MESVVVRSCSACLLCLGSLHSCDRDGDIWCNHIACVSSVLLYPVLHHMVYRFVWCGALVYFAMCGEVTYSSYIVIAFNILVAIRSCVRYNYTVRAARSIAHWPGTRHAPHASYMRVLTVYTTRPPHVPCCVECRATPHVHAHGHVTCALPYTNNIERQTDANPS